ncbi:MAG: hypothetical protein ACRDLB_13200 [Actinomycetota bacterium]
MKKLLAALATAGVLATVMPVPAAAQDPWDPGVLIGAAACSVGATIEHAKNPKPLGPALADCFTTPF